MIGIDFDAEVVNQQQEVERKVTYGDPSITGFWKKVDNTHSIMLVMLALPNLFANLEALQQLQEIAFTGQTTEIVVDEK